MKKNIENTKTIKMQKEEVCLVHRVEHYNPKLILT